MFRSAVHVTIFYSLSDSIHMNAGTHSFRGQTRHFNTLSFSSLRAKLAKTHKNDIPTAEYLNV